MKLRVRKRSMMGVPLEFADPSSSVSVWQSSPQSECALMGTANQEGVGIQSAHVLTVPEVGGSNAKLSSCFVSNVPTKLSTVISTREMYVLSPRSSLTYSLESSVQVAFALIARSPTRDWISIHCVGATGTRGSRH